MEIRQLDPEENIEAKKISCLSFGLRRDFAEEFEDPYPRPSEWTWGYFDYEKLVSCVTSIPYAMRFDGHTVGMSGISGVCSLPEYRRDGNIFRILHEIFETEYEYGTVFSCLNPFSHSFYRRMGYELCNCRMEIRVPIHCLTHLKFKGSFNQHFPGDSLDDLQYIHSCYIKGLNHAIARDVWPDQMAWKIFANNDPYKTGISTYIWKDESGKPKGYIQLKQEDENQDRQITILEVAFASSEALYGVLSLLYVLQWQKHKDLVWQAPTFIGFTDIIPENHSFTLKLMPRDMTRIINVEKALEIMRHPEGSGVYTLEVRDPQLSANNGIFQVEYSEEGSRVTRVGKEADITLEMPALSQLVTGHRTLENALMSRRDLQLHKNFSVLQKVFTLRPSHLTESF
ncbi:MAG: GNAT family N-acetyltransferase [Clostridiales bacterium]|jgi:predicted acetyltransferase|nr:GNAT family N-acetyltransferase [Clostridiales bacterium]